MILSIPYQVEGGILDYHPSPAPKVMTNAHSIDHMPSHCEAYSFPEGISFVPDKVELSHRTKYRDQSGSVRLCVLDKNRLHYKVFTMPDYVSGPAAMDDDVSMT
jgi:hypothetical protein